MWENVKNLPNHVVGRHFHSETKRRPTLWVLKFLTFSLINSVFFQPNWAFRLLKARNKLKWVEKRLNLWGKMSKICKIILSTDIFTTCKTLHCVVLQKLLLERPPFRICHADQAYYFATSVDVQGGIFVQKCQRALHMNFH